MEALMQAQDSLKSWISTPPGKCTLPRTQTMSELCKILLENQHSWERKHLQKYHFL